MLYTGDMIYTVDMFYTVDTVYTVMWPKMGYVVDEAEGADRADGTDETDMAEMALCKCMNALFYFDCLGRFVFWNRSSESESDTNHLHFYIFCSFCGHRQCLIRGRLTRKYSP